MIAYKEIRSVLLIAVAVLALPLLASARPKATTTHMEKKSIQLDKSTTVDGKTLAPGNYEVLIQGDKITFERDGQNVLTAPCDWKTLKFKSPYDATTYSAKGVLQELQFEGSNRAVEVM